MPGDIGSTGWRRVLFSGDGEKLRGYGVIDAWMDLVKTGLSKVYHKLPEYTRLLFEGRLLCLLRERRQYLEYLRHQRRLMDDIASKCSEFNVIEEIFDRTSGGPQYMTAELAQFWYASEEITRIAPREVYDVGSHRSWLIGVSAGLPVHSLDVREPTIIASNEVFHPGRAEEMPFGADSVQCMTSICSLEHFGLGSYGDPYDPEGDRKAVREICRVLQPGGYLVLTTLCTGRARPFIVFNTRRVYTLGWVRQMFSALEQVKEKIFSTRFRSFVGDADLQTELAPYAFDIYMATWRKPAR